jgi:hypothetical protein
VTDNITLPRAVVEQVREALLSFDNWWDDEADTALAALDAALAEPTHPDYIIGSHWLETAYSRICAGDAEADVMRDYGLIREEAFTIGVEHLRQENERLKAERDEAVKAEREACAKLCDQEVGELAYGNDDWYIAKTLAAVIRARGET